MAQSPAIKPNMLGSSLQSEYAPDEKFIDFRKSYEEAMHHNDLPTAGKFLQQMGKVCFEMGYYSKSLEYFQQALTLFSDAKKRGAEASVLNDMGQLYYRGMDKNASKALHDRALHIYQALGDKAGIAETWGYIGHYYEKQRHYDSAFYFQWIALAKSKETRDTGSIASIYENLGSVHEDLARYDSALYYFRNALLLYEMQHNRWAAIEDINNIGDIFRKTGRYREAIPYSHEAMAIARLTHNRYQEAAACKDLGETFNLLGNNDSAYYYMKRSRKLLLDIYSVQNSQQTNLLRILYETAKKDKAIETMQKNRIIYLTLVGLALLVIALFITVISRQKMKIGRARLISERDAERNRIQQELIEQKTGKLANHTLGMIQKNRFLEELRNSLMEMVKEERRDQKKQMQQLVQKINQNTNYEKQWQEFNSIFEQVHPSFFQKLHQQFPDLTSTDIKLLALHKVGMESRDMGVILGISLDSLRVYRYRLRKKMKLPDGINLSKWVGEL